jgi:shikimate dehydrogenase
MAPLLKLGIIGQPLTHSLSPLLHAQLMHRMELNGEYRKYELSADGLADALNTLAEQGIRGLNVTIPHKVAVMPLLNQLSAEAELAGAVNTIVFEADGTRKGYNTDISGFMRSLPIALIDRLPESNVLVLGAGGSARAVLAGLIQMGAAAITFAVRDPQRAVSLLGDAEMMKQAYRANTQINTVSLFSLPSLESFQALINTTPVGMWPAEEQSPLTPIQLETLPTGSVVYDLVYRPPQTRLLQDAANLGLPTVNGLDMLLYQGICSFELWQDKSVSQDIVSTVRRQLHDAVSEVPS